MPSYFCPRCWSELKRNYRKCPVCGYDIREFERLNYEDKLIVALKHPVREFRINAIRLLGRMKSEKALDYFEQIIEKEKDVFILKEVAEALSKIDTERGEKLLRRLAEHRAVVVSREAKRHLENFKFTTLTGD